MFLSARDWDAEYDDEEEERGADEDEEDAGEDPALDSLAAAIQFQVCFSDDNYSYSIDVISDYMFLCNFLSAFSKKDFVL